MDKSYLKHYLDCFLSNEDVKNPKPDPEIYIKAIESLRMKPKECLVVEDNKNGIKAAIQSGAHLFEVKEVSDVTYDNIINRIHEINSCDEA
jgi:HAD superfamily hydrolase (TIGR01509 family)